MTGTGKEPYVDYELTSPRRGSKSEATTTPDEANVSKEPEPQLAIWELQEAVGCFAKAIRKGTSTEVQLEAAAIMRAVAAALEANSQVAVPGR